MYRTIIQVALSSSCNSNLHNADTVIVSNIHLQIYEKITSDISVPYLSYKNHVQVIKDKILKTNM